MKTTKLFMMVAALICATTAWAQTRVATDDELRAAIQTDGANITVTADIDLSNSTLSIASGTTVTIDLGGHTLDRHLTNRGEGGGQVITVRSGGTLNLSNGTLKGGWGGDSGGINNEGGTANLTNVTITSCTGDDRGGGICNRSGGTLTMTGCTITGNICNSHPSDGGGGGIYNSEGATTTLDGCTVTGNITTLYGGGGICNYGTLNMQNANTITGNTGNVGVTNNVYLKTGTLITVTGCLEGSQIGITSETLPYEFTKDYWTYNSTYDISTCFQPDLSEIMVVSLNENKEGEIADIEPEPTCYIERAWDDERKEVTAKVKLLKKVIPFDYAPTSEQDYKMLSKKDDETVDLGTKDCPFHEFYVINGFVEVNDLNVVGPNVHIVLRNGSNLVFRYGCCIHVGEGHSLYIHDQGSAEKMGKISAYGLGAIGGNAGTEAGGSIEIHGGKIDLKGYLGLPAIGGSYDKGSDIKIYSGNIRAEGNTGSAGIGGASERHSYGTINIYGGKIQAIGGVNESNVDNGNGAGIGGGKDCEGGYLHIYGGEITATTNSESAGIGCGQVSGAHGAGTIIIDGGTVKAYGGDYSAGIGGGDSANGGDLTINGGRVFAYGGTDAAGIGGGEGGNGGKVTINGGYVYAEGNDNGAGIGGGEDGAGADVTINGGTVIAKAGGDQRAIGAGYGSDSHGSLTFADDLGVFITTNLNRSVKENRVKDCRNFSYVRINQCAHGDATATVIDGDKHSISNCKWCYTMGEEAHAFGDYGECSVCKLIRLEDEGDNSALFTKWADGDVHDFFINRQKLVPNEEGSRAYTVCLPFDMDLRERVDDLTVYTLSYIKDGKEMVFTQTPRKIEAGKPYLIVIHKGELELLSRSKLITTADEGVRVYDWANKEQPLGWWRGTLTKIESADAAAMMAYALQSVGDFRRIRPDTYWAWWGAFRSMYCPDALPATNKFTINKATFDGFGGQTVNVTFEGDAEIPDETTGISLTPAPSPKGEGSDYLYTLDGRKLQGKPTQKGIYIVNGNKVVIK